MDFGTSEMLEEFTKNVAELLDKMINTIMRLKDNKTDKNEINELFRITHSIKGIAASMQFLNMEKISHKIEDVLYVVREGKLEINDDMLGTIGRAYVNLATLMDAVTEAGNEEDFPAGEINDIVAEIEKYLGKEEEHEPQKEYFSDEALAKIFNAGGPVNLIIVGIEEGCMFKSVRGYMTIKAVEKYIEIKGSVPSFETLSDGSANFNQLYMLCDIEPKLQNVVKEQIMNIGEIANVSFIEIKNIEELKAIIGIEESEEYTDSADVEITEAVQEEAADISEYHEIIREEVESLMEDIDIDVVNLADEDEKKLYITSIMEKTDKTLEILQFIKNEEACVLLRKMEKILNLSIDRQVTLHSEEIDMILDSTIYIRKLLEPEKTSGNRLFNERYEAHLRAIDNFIAKNSQNHEEKIGVLLAKSKILSNEEVNELVKLQKEKYPELKLGEIAVLEKKATSKDILEALRQQQKINEKKGDKQDSAYEYIKIKSAKADDLLDLVEKIITVHSRLDTHTQNSGCSNSEFLSEVKDLSNIIREIQNISMSFRMTSLKTMFQNLKMTFRDTVKKLDKKVKIEIEGEETEIDRLVAGRLYEPLLHIIKNSIGHGIESEEERIAAGKNIEGTVTIKAYSEKGYVYIEAGDDGAGINHEKVFSKALEKNLIDQRRKYTDTEIEELIFLPGFSTAKEVDSISGRGVGMDVVKTEITKLKGKIKIENKPGQGVKFILKVMKNTSALSGTVVNINKAKYIIPSFYIKEIYGSGMSETISIMGRKKMVKVNDSIFPLLDNKRFFDECNNDGEIMIILENEKKLKGLSVKEIIEKCDVVVRPLGDEFDKTEWFYGAAVISNGEPAVILNIENMFGND